MTVAPPLARPARSLRAVPVATIVVIGMLAMLVSAPAPARADHADLDGDDPTAVDLVYASAEAPRRISYTGTQYVSAWSSLDPTAASSSTVMTLEHQAGGITRVGVPNQQAAILEWRESTSWLAGGGGSAELLLAAYHVSVAGTGTVAGRPTVIVEARRDNGAVAARLWLDATTALTLRRETFDPDGNLLSASAFVDIVVRLTEPGGDVGTTTRPSPTAAAARLSAGGGDSALNWSDIQALRDHGWHCPDSLSGGLRLYEAHRYGDVVHLSYSDGVMTVSVFEQPGRLDRDGMDGYQRVEAAGGTVFAAPGPPARFMWSSGDQVLTVVSEAPVSVLDDLTTQLPPDAHHVPPPPDDGILARIVRGAKKVGSFLNPFD